MKKTSFLLTIVSSLISINAISANSNSTSIETGDITFATLNSSVNGERPNHLIDATVIEGKYKGAKLHGTLTTTKSESGNLDRISLHFTSMNADGKSKPVEITAYAIDVN